MSSDYPHKNIGGLLFVDFINTEVWHGDEREERIGSMSAFCGWMRSADYPCAQEFAAIFASLDREATDRLLQKLLSLRTRLRNWVKIMSGERNFRHAPDANFLDDINRALTQLPIHQRLVDYRADSRGRNKPSFMLEAISRPSCEASALTPIFRSVAEFLATGDARRLKKCANPRCSHFFYDASKNGSRRWCCMSSCGNIHKVREYFKRRRKEKKASKRTMRPSK